MYFVLHNYVPLYRGLSHEILVKYFEICGCNVTKYGNVLGVWILLSRRHISIATVYCLLSYNISNVLKILSASTYRCNKKTECTSVHLCIWYQWQQYKELARLWSCKFSPVFYYSHCVLGFLQNICPWSGRSRQLWTMIFKRRQWWLYDLICMF